MAPKSRNAVKSPALTDSCSEPDILCLVRFLRHVTSEMFERLNRIEADGNVLQSNVTVSHISNANDTAQNTATAQTAVQIVTATSPIRSP